MTDFLNEADLNEDFAPDFEEYEDEGNQLHDDMKGGRKAKEEIDIDESIDFELGASSPTKMHTNKAENSYSARNKSQPSTPGQLNEIEMLSPTLESESNLKKRHDRLKSNDQNEQTDDNDEYVPEAEPSQRRTSSRHSQLSHRSGRSITKKRAGGKKGESEIEILKAANKDLTNQLMQLSRVLDNQLNLKGIKMSKKSISSESSQQSESSEEYQSLLKQLQMYKKANAELKKQVYSVSAEKSVEYKNQVKAKRDDIKKLQQEIVALKNIQREQSKQLEVFTNGNEELQKKHEEELKFANGETRRYKEENGKLQAQLDKLHQQLVYYKEQAASAQEILRNKNITVGSAKQVKQLQADLEAERKKSEDLEKKLAISQKAVETWKRKNFIEQRRNKQEMENLEGKLGELQEGDQKSSSSAFQRARQMSEKRKRRPAVNQPLSPSSKGESKIPKPSAAKKTQIDPTKAKQSRIPKYNEKSESKSQAPKKKNNKTNKKEESVKDAPAVGESIDFGDLDLDEDFAADFEVEDNAGETEPTENTAAEDLNIEDEKIEVEEEVNEEDHHESQANDIFKPPF